MNACDNGINYFKRQQSLEKICDTNVDAVVEILPGTNRSKSILRRYMPLFGIDRTSTKVEDLCPCTCGKENSTIVNENVW